jgi:hypothetical protein
MDRYRKAPERLSNLQGHCSPHDPAFVVSGFDAIAPSDLLSVRAFLRFRLKYGKCPRSVPAVDFLTGSSPGSQF